MSLVTDLASLARDLRAEGIPFDWSIERANDGGMDPPLPLPVRLHAELLCALGSVVIEMELRPDEDMRIQYARTRRLDGCRSRLLATLRDVEALGKRSRWADWFRRSA